MKNFSTAVNKKKISVHAGSAERGMALLFALGVLSVILVMVLLFASRTKVEATISAAHTDNKAAEILARSLVNRIAMTLDKSEGLTDQILFSSAMNFTDNDDPDSGATTWENNSGAEDSDDHFGAPPAATFDWIWKLETSGRFEFEPNTKLDSEDLDDLNIQTDGSTEMYSGTFAAYTEFGNSKAKTRYYDKRYLPTWQYILDPKNEKFIARFAFVTIPQSGKLNPNAIANHTYCRNLGKGVAATNDKSCAFCASKPGVSAAELFFDMSFLNANFRDSDNIDEGDVNDNMALTHTPNDKSGTSTSNAYTLNSYLRDRYYNRDTTDWLSFQDFLIDGVLKENFDIPTQYSNTDDIKTYLDAKNMVEAYFEILPTHGIYDENKNQTKPGEGCEREAFWSDLNGNGKIEDNEWFHRFNMRRTDWATLNVNDILKEPKWFKDEDDYKVFKSNYNQNFDTGGIAWLNNWTDGGDWEDKDATKKQIAANLLNYCSPASRECVSDVNQSEWDTDADNDGVGDKTPEYTGLKRTLYANEVYYHAMLDTQVEVDKSIPEEGSASAKVTVKHRLAHKIAVELVDMYYDTLGGYAKNANPSKVVPYFANNYNVVLLGKISYEYLDQDGSNPSADSWKKVEIDLKQDLDDFKMQTVSRRTGYYIWSSSKELGKDKSGGLQNADTDATITYTISGTKEQIDAVSAETEFKKNWKVRKFKVTLDRVLVKCKNYITAAAGGSSAADWQYVDIALLELNDNAANETAENLYYNKNKDDSGYVLEMNNATSDAANSKIALIAADFEIDDPRQNLRRSDWEKAKPFEIVSKAIPDELGPAKYSSDVTVSFPAGQTATGKNRNSEPEYEKSSATYGTEKKRDYEVTSDPAWVTKPASKLVTAKNHISTAFIRHAEPVNSSGDDLKSYRGQAYPMESLWELGAIHRGSAWCTLAIATGRSFDDNTHNKQRYTETPSGYKSEGDENGGSTSEIQGGGEYKYGDSPILDQVKMINDIYCAGKVNLCRYVLSDIRYFTLGSLFHGMPYKTEGHYVNQQLNNSWANVQHSAVNQDLGNQIKRKADSNTKMRNLSVENFVDRMYSAYSSNYQTDVTKNKFFRRSDIMREPSGDDKKDSRDQLFPLRYLPADGATDALDEQMVGRIINNIKVVPQTSKSVTAVLLVQTLRDPGNTTIYKDWNANGKIDSNDLSMNNPDTVSRTAQFMSGYRRFREAGKNDVPFASNVSVREKIQPVNKKYKYYREGLIAITGESKMIVTLELDPNTNRWIETKYEYAE